MKNNCVICKHFRTISGLQNWCDAGKNIDAENCPSFNVISSIVSTSSVDELINVMENIENTEIGVPVEIEAIEDMWKPIDELVIDESIKTIHCDTRDFHCKTNGNSFINKIDIKNTLDKVIASGKYTIPASCIKEWLQGLQEIAGGRAEWRCLVFDNVDCDGWLKYIRFHRVDNDMFVVCNRDNIPIEWRNCTKENLDTETLLSGLE